MSEVEHQHEQETEELDETTDSEVVGESVNSKYGRRLVAGNGEYLDDIRLPGTRHAYFCRSEVAHAEIEVVDVAICEDLGKVMNPKLVEGQAQGGIVQGLGEVLLEDYAYDDDGILDNDTLIDYHPPTTEDVPLITKIEHVENPDPTTSHGQKGAGECPTVPTPAAVANAVADATGIRFTEEPLSAANVLPELVEEGLREL
jgi:CO/xanthine dehydrogenase Mo-binding subunit